MVAKMARNDHSVRGRVDREMEIFVISACGYCAIIVELINDEWPVRGNL